MPECDHCGGRAAQLARTASRVWLGCPRCHRTWNADVEGRRTTPDDEMPFPLEGADRSAQMSGVRGCLMAVLTVSVALLVRMLLRGTLGNASPFLLFTPAVAIAAFYGGVLPAVVATVLSTALGSHYFLDGLGEPVVEKWDRVFLFVVVAAVMTAASTVLRRSRRQLAASLWREQKARAMAEAADRTKDDFLAVMSHELQTPMSVVVGWIAAIRQRRVEPATLAHALDAVERNARILSRLVDDVLDRSRIATGTLRLDCQVISLRTALLAAVDQMHARIGSAGLQLKVAASDDVAIVGDSIRLQQVFTNLLSNAVKFTPADGQICVALTVKAAEARVTVADSGSGIASDVLPHVFDAFRQGHETLHQSSHGLGLGLSIARSLVERHQGTISVVSEGPGRGATFTVTLPVARQPLLNEQPPRFLVERQVRGPRAIH
jgi:signal transduction histidine kinase